MRSVSLSRSRAAWSHDLMLARHGPPSASLVNRLDNFAYWIIKPGHEPRGVMGTSPNVPKLQFEGCGEFKIDDEALLGEMKCA